MEYFKRELQRYSQTIINMVNTMLTSISTDGGTNTWQLGAPTVGAPTPDTNIIVTINGTQYKIAAEEVIAPPPGAGDVEFTVNGADFDFFRISNSTEIIVDWGDGTAEAVAIGSDQNVTHTYSVAGTYQIKLHGTVTLFAVNSNDFGNNADYLNSIETLSGDILTFDVSFNNNLNSVDFSGLANCTIFKFRNNIIFNQVVDFSTLTNCADFYFNGNTSFNQTVDFSALANCVYYEFTGNSSFTQSIDISALTSCIEIYINNNNISVADINAGLIFADTNGILNGTWASEGQTPAAAPTGAGATAAANLIGKGWTVTTD